MPSPQASMGARAGMNVGATATLSGPRGSASAGSGNATIKLKSFDFVVYSQNGRNLLVDVKGRKHSGKTGRSLQNWVTRDDVDCMKRWAGIFGADFEPAFAFLYWCESQPPDALFHEVFVYNHRWYALLALRLADYTQHMTPRSQRWDTVSMPAATFGQLAEPLAGLL